MFLSKTVKFILAIAAVAAGFLFSKQTRPVTLTQKKKCRDD
jgi:hypothetical protein